MTTSRQEYIDQYAEYAMEQMRKYGIPASITLAQGIIESADGKSMLSKTANNHFGVKGEFNGAYVRADDDKPNEKFKKYDNVGQSYEDHSKVLMGARYQKYTRNLAADDYKGWAKGIKAGGYASSSKYVNTIVGVIEGANLHKYDQIVMAEAKKEGKKIGSEDYQKSSASSTAKEPQQYVKTDKTASNGLYSLPLDKKEFMLVTSPFGMRNDPINKGQKQFHKGIDINCKNENLLATENNGKVISVSNSTNTGGGKTVTIEYERPEGSKVQVSYMHMSAIDVKEGDTVKAGQKIGVSGNTGTRTTGPHLHFEVKTVGRDSNNRNIDPAAYLAEISQKGGMNQQLLCNGKDLLDKYKADNPLNAEQVAQKTEDMTPDGWMKKLLSSEDSSVGVTKGDPIMEHAMTMFSSLMVLALQIDGKSDTDKMQKVTDAAVSRQIDLTSLVPVMKDCRLNIDDQGRGILVMNNGKQSTSHVMTESEMQKLSSALNDSSLSDDMKRQRISGIINSIAIGQQVSQNYEQARDQSQEQSETIQRK